MHQTIQFYGLAADVRINDVTLVLLTESSFDDTHPLVSYQTAGRKTLLHCGFILNLNDDTCVQIYPTLVPLQWPLHCPFLGFFWN